MPARQCVIISQDLDEIFAICDRIAVIYQGTLFEARPIAPSPSRRSAC